MEAVNAFNFELFSLMDSKPPISRAKMISITKSAIKAMKLYKHVVQIVEKFIRKCKPEYKVAGLYVVDSIVRQSRHQFGADKDVFGPRFTKNISETFENLCLCPVEDRSKIVRVLNLWQKNGVFKIEVIQPLLDMAAGTSSATAPYSGTDEPGSSPTPAKELVTTVTTNSTATSAAQLQTSDAIAAVAQLFQSSQGQQLQQMLQTFQQQPAKPESNCHLPVHLVQAQVPNVTAGANTVAPPPALHAEPAQQKTAFDKKLLDRFDYDDEPEAGEDTKKDEIPSQLTLWNTCSAMAEGWCFSLSVSVRVELMEGFCDLSMQQPPAFLQHPEHFNPQMLNVTQEQFPLHPNGQPQAFGLPPSQNFPAMMPQMGHALPGQLLPGSTGPPGFPGMFPPHNASQQQRVSELSMEMEQSSLGDDRHDRQSSYAPGVDPGGPVLSSVLSNVPSLGTLNVCLVFRSPKRRRSRSNSRTRMSKHRRSRSRSRERRYYSPHSRSQERRERDKERERRQKGLPPPKSETLSICSTTLWVGQLDKRTQQQDVACLLEEFGQIESINMIPPRGCAYIVMTHRQDAYRALQKLSRGSHKVNQKAIKIAWALNKGIKSELKQYWDVELGVTYIPWSKIREVQLEELKEGGILDVETLSPEWTTARKAFELPEEHNHNGRSEAQHPEEMSVVPVVAPVAQVNTGYVLPYSFPVAQVQQPAVSVGSLQPPVFSGALGMPQPSFPPGIPPPPFIRPAFNPLQMPPGRNPKFSPGFPPPGAMTLGPPPPSKVEDPPLDPGGQSNRQSDEGLEGANIFNSQMGPIGQSGSFSSFCSSCRKHRHLPVVQKSGQSNQVGGPAGSLPGGPPGGLPPPSGGLLGARPGLIPLQRPPVPPPPHMQRFPPIIPRGPHPQLIHHDPPQSKGGFGPPPPHSMRPSFPSHRPPALGPPQGPPAHGPPQGPPAHGPPQGPPAHGPPQGPPAHGPPQGPPAHGPPQGPPAQVPPPQSLSPQGPPPFFRPGGARVLEGPEEIDGRSFRGDRPAFRDREPERERNWDRDRDRGFGGGRRPFSDDTERDRGRSEGGERGRADGGSRERGREAAGKEGDRPRRAERRER
uniref:SR-related CTD associated factor 4 n=1 Tax=Tetraodon nigroviridis TaxID=99883 RepID=H3CX52_TETNG